MVSESGPESDVSPDALSHWRSLFGSLVHRHMSSSKLQEPSGGHSFLMDMSSMAMVPLEKADPVLA